jgi:hypothetical protein
MYYSVIVSYYQTFFAGSAETLLGPTTGREQPMFDAKGLQIIHDPQSEVSNPQLSLSPLFLDDGIKRLSRELLA